jgi:membrane protein
VKLIAIGLTIGVGSFILVSFGLVVAGPALAEPIANWVGLGHAFAVAWRIIQWPIVFILVTVAVGLIYYFGPDAEQQWEWITPGSLLATVLWILISLGFRFYVTSFGNFNATYGTIGGVIVAMLWMYISGLAILIGAEANVEIENAAPWGKAKGEKRPGRRKLGRAAAAAYAAAHEGGDHPQASVPPAVVPRPFAPPVVGAPRRRASDRVRVSDWIVGGAALVAELALAARSLRKRVKG